MKLLTFRVPPSRRERFGVLLASGQVLDLSSLHGDRRLPGTLLACIRSGSQGLAAVRAAVEKAEAALKDGRALLASYGLVEIVCLPPLIPGKILAVGRNYGEHAAETGLPSYSRPSGFVKLTSTLIGHGGAIRKPRWTSTLDYENELAVVIGRDGVNIPTRRAYDYVFGYTIMNDVSAREVQNQERREGNILVGKNFPTAAPLGPWVVTRDEVPDPHNLRLTTRVNGEIRQHSSTGDQIHKIPAQIAWYSRTGLQAGDLIATGTPAGTAVGYRGPGAWYLQRGDAVECEIEGIGVLRNTVQ
ncbi:MAG: fumarylacetoacetate hydrolase family protein [Chloroflexi bacterium]|nr:fumarylacetoacetate hydrolase family protein [Chloroflexota bacterium]